MIPCAEVNNRNTSGLFSPDKSSEQKQEIRESYGCQCNARNAIGRVNPHRTDHILKGIEVMTGVRIAECPWRAMTNPLVTRTMQLFGHYETGNLAAFLTEKDDERQWQALEQYIRFSNTVKAKQWDERIEAAKQKARQEENKRGK